MKRLALILAATAFFALPMQAAMADTVEDLVEVLEEQGYRDISVERTLLGRTRILAVGEDGTRELILNARTGEVLRDVWIDKKGRTRPSDLSRKDDDDDDHDSDDKGGDDHHNSGHGGGGDDGDDD
jgi:hypothetical protein